MKVNLANLAEMFRINMERGNIGAPYFNISTHISREQPAVNMHVQSLNSSGRLEAVCVIHVGAFVKQSLTWCTLRHMGADVSGQQVDGCVADEDGGRRLLQLRVCLRISADWMRPPAGNPICV